MKRLSIIITLLFATTIAKAQQAGQLYVTSYDDTGQIVYICDGQAQNTVDVQFAMLNLNQSVPLTIDSMIPQGNPSAFPFQQAQYTTFELADVFVGGDATFSPSVPGDDTIHETVFYNGKYTATAAIIFHARSSPDIAMYGYAWSTAFSEGTNSFGSFNQQDVFDTMYDDMNATQSSIQYYMGSMPSENGGIAPGDQPVMLLSCGGATIDSIYEVGDFSDFSFDPFPKLPFNMAGEDSLVLNYEFTPKTVDTTGSHHYLVFHSTDGHYLVWSFVYYIYPASSVSETVNQGDEIQVFPNPATDALQILGGQTGTIHLFDLMGRERMTANNDGTSTTLDVSSLESGIYFLREGNQSTKVEIAR
jgi:hypothetical protein